MLGHIHHRALTWRRHVNWLNRGRSRYAMTVAFGLGFADLICQLLYLNQWALSRGRGGLCCDA